MCGLHELPVQGQRGTAGSQEHYRIMTNCYRAPGNDFVDSIIPLKGSCYLANSSFVASTCACCGRGPVAYTHEKAKGDE